MTNKSVLVSAIALFVIVNTSYFWEAKLSIFIFLVFLLLIILWLVISIKLIFELWQATQERFQSRQRLLSIGIMSFVVISTFLYPKGLIDFNKLEGKDLVIAQREAGGNCQIELQLKENAKFIERVYCFGITEYRGRYEIKGDTVFFKDKKGQPINGFYKYGIIKKEGIEKTASIPCILLFYKPEKWDNFLLISKNALK